MIMSSNVIWTALDAVKATGGQCHNDWSATGLSIDTRTLKPGDLFIALQGDLADGHDYVPDAAKKGAVAAMVSNADLIDMSVLPSNFSLLVVEDTLTALENLGKASRERSAAHVVGVTGSVGKTGTKEMLATVFDVHGQTHAAKASYNNHIGVPLTLASMHSGTDYGVFEIGMNHAGEITPLTKMVQPDIAIITTIAEVHIENFENIQGIADAKAEIFQGVKEGGQVILNQDNEWFDYLSAKAQALGLKVYSFGAAGSADGRLVECLVASNGNRITANILGEDVSFSTQISGQHIAMNALSVLLAVKLSNGDIQKAAKALEKTQAITGRGKREYLNLGDPENPVTLIDESYNASPASMQAAFKVLALIDPGRGGRRIAILGDMLELGNKAPDYHKQLALPLEAANVQLVYTCGQHMKALHDNLPANTSGEHRNTSKELAQIVPDVLTPGDVVMVKGSLGSQMGIVVEALRALPAGHKSSDNNSTGGDDHYAV